MTLWTQNTDEVVREAAHVRGLPCCGTHRNPSSSGDAHAEIIECYKNTRGKYYKSLACSCTFLDSDVTEYLWTQWDTAFWTKWLVGLSQDGSFYWDERKKIDFFFQQEKKKKTQKISLIYDHKFLCFTLMKRKCISIYPDSVSFLIYFFFIKNVTSIQVKHTSSSENQHFTTTSYPQLLLIKGLSSL